MARSAVLPTRQETVVLLTGAALLTGMTVLVVHSPSSVNGPLQLVPGLYGIVAGLLCRRWVGLIPVLLMVGPVDVPQGYLNPLPVVLAIGFWLIGHLLREQRILGRNLEARALELASEREVFARESVRYERTRIARELHDIVGHGLSIVAVQAAAGERLAAHSPLLAIQALDDLTHAAEQARAEVASLAELLRPVEAATALPSLVADLVTTATASGLDITCRVTGTFDELTDAQCQVAYRLLQESLTNVLRHAPGAGVRVDVAATVSQLTVEVTNGVSPDASESLDLVSGGRGLVGMQSRVTEAGGSFATGPTENGGWFVRGDLPLTPEPAATNRTDRWRRRVPGRGGTARDRAVV